ncbi:LCP family protein [Geodermatophilus sp. YIM 151500]|uniref:LCP family protein n=1 Tax=Geodermatophilus sp. YIM 151500 TaxID=2984531 RepID=UPI0021E37D40|nr:LCP family protein [Geodermatophilus sp. YIM 151500]MCV2490352.1 LCP family protein [Geodermatophilus sp. YIM 151500]
MVGALVALVGVVVLYHLGLYFYVDRSIDRVDALATDGPEVLAAQLQADAENYLVVGTGVPGQEGAPSVTALLVSVAADADRAVLVSLPPTALVDTPACRTPDGDVRQPVAEAFGTSLLEGGPSCMVRSVQQLTGLRIDHYLGIDLDRLPGLVDALGGVPVCLPGAAPAPAGSGATSLTAAAVDEYLRPGDAGTDVTGAGVAQRTQVLLTATLRAALSPSTLADPLTLTPFLVRAAGGLTVDSQTTLGDLRELAGSLGDLPQGAVQRAELPVAQLGYVPTGSDQAFVLLDGAATRALFDEVIGQTRVPADILAAQEAEAAARAQAQAAADAAAGTPADDAAGSAPEAPAEPAGPVVPPEQVTLSVLNGTGTTGLAGTAAESLRGLGFTVGEVGNEPGAVEATLVRHGPGVAEEARTVAAAVPGAVLQPTDAIGDAVQLVLGPGYAGVVPVELAAPAPPAETPAEQPAPDPAAQAAAQPVVARC